MKNRLITWIVLVGCLLFLSIPILRKIEYWLEEKTLGPPYEAVRTCLYLEKEIPILATEPDGMPPPDDCLAGLVTMGRMDAIPTDPWGKEYEVRLDTNGTIQVWSCGPDGVAGSTDDLNAQSPVIRPHQRKTPWGGGI